VRLPIFPLGVVLLPGTPAPLHIFEPRYRQLIADIRSADRRFVILPAMPGVAERDIPAGRVGCVAEVTEFDILPDGRANILTIGRERVVLDRFVDDPAPYVVAEVAELPDAPGAARVALMVVADEITANFRRLVRAVQTLNDEPHAPIPLPDDPVDVAWQIGAMIDTDVETRYKLLAERSPLARLRLLDELLRKELPDLELRAAMHRG